MKVDSRVAWVVWCAFGGVLGCGSDPIEIAPEPPITHTASFVGYVYDGVTGQRLTGYGLGIEARDTRSEASVAEDGRYLIADLSVWDDYTVTIDADGYRTFVSHNASVGLPAGVSGQAVSEVSTEQTLHFDAYLFPADLVADAVTLTIQTPVSGETPAGQIRLRPTSASILADQGGETPVGVPDQIWHNDEDLQAGTMTDAFAGGQHAIAAGALVFGVTYQVDIWQVPGYQPLLGSYQAGIEADKTFLLVEVVHAPLALVSSSHEFCEPPATPTDTTAATVSVVLNQDVEAATTNYPGGHEELLDDGLSMSSPNADADTESNTLRADAAPDARERGVTLSINGDTVEIHWSPADGLATSDPDDPIVSVTYTGLESVYVQRVGSPGSALSLAELLGTSSITCP